MQDDPAAIGENYRRLLEAIDCERRPIRRVHQVHGARVVIVSGNAPLGEEQADALVSDDPASLVSVRVADCVPVLLASVSGRWVAAVHAGWRSVVAGVIGVAAGELKEKAGEALVAAIGPCIGVDAFEVGPEVLAEFRRVFGVDAPVRPGTNGKGYVDLREAVRMQLRSAGVDRIDCTDRCTFRDADEFYSHRRDGGVTGRMAAVIGPSI